MGNRIDEQLNLIDEALCIFVQTSEGVSQLIPVSVAINAMFGDPPSFFVVERRQQLVLAFDVFELFFGSIDP